MGIIQKIMDNLTFVNTNLKLSSDDGLRWVRLQNFKSVTSIHNGEGIECVTQDGRVFNWSLDYYIFMAEYQLQNFTDRTGKDYEYESDNCN